MSAKKKGAKELVKSPAQKAAATRAKKKAEADRLEKANAQRLAQIVNLHISGMSLAQIGTAIGATAEDVDRLLQRDAARYVRSQPALRVYVRNYISERYSQMLDAVWDAATDEQHTQKLEHQDRALRILDKMTKLHGAEAPTQTEVKVEHAPEAVEQLVKALSATQGYGYDESVFDIVDADVVDDAVSQSGAALLSASAAVEEPVEGETL